MWSQGWGAASQAAVVSIEVARRARRGAIVIVDDPTKHLSTLDGARVLRLPEGDGELLSNPLMGASYVVVVVDKLSQHSPQMSLIEDEDMIQAFLSGCSYPSFGIGIGISRQLHLSGVPQNRSSK